MRLNGYSDGFSPSEGSTIVLRRLALFVCAFAFAVAPDLSAQTSCSNASPWYYSMHVACDKTNTDGPCALSQTGHGVGDAVLA